MSLLTIIQAAADEIGLPRPSSVVGNTSDQVRQLLSLLNREGKELAKHTRWGVLVRPHSFATTDGEEEYDLPSDFAYLLDGTVWNRSATEPVLGALTPIQWRAIKEGYLGSLVRDRYRISRASSGTSRKFYVNPTPGATSETLVFEYVSTQWCSDPSGTSLRSAFSADTDVALLDEDLLTMGLIWRFRRAKGLTYATELQEYENSRDLSVARDAPAPTLSITPATSRRMISPWNVPDTGYGPQ